MLAGAVATLGLSACCAGPLLLVVLALGGAWGSRLTALRPYQPHFSPFLLLFAVAFRRLYTRLETCAVDEAYSVHSVPHRQSIIF
jgi:mercuric ion transport protein